MILSQYPSFLQIKVFITTVETGSFSRAGEELSITQSAVSRHISALEDIVGSKLFIRSTRVLRLTETAKIFEKQARQMLKHWQMTKLMLESQSDCLTGEIHIVAPQVFGDLWVSPNIGKFLDQHPGLTLHMHITEERESILEKGYDLVIRTGTLPDSNLYSRSICNDRLVMVATEKFINEYGPFATPADVPADKCLMFRGDNSWQFSKDGEVYTIRPDSRIVSENPYTLLSMVDCGDGITLVPMWFAKSDRYKETYVRLFTEYEISSAMNYYCEANFLYPTRQPSNKVAPIMDMILSKLKNA